MNSIVYQKILEEHLIPFAQEIYGQNWIFQQDNAPIHSSRPTKTWLKDKNIDFIHRPANSSDLNIIENAWGILTRKVYQDGRQFSKVNDLKTSIKTA